MTKFFAPQTLIFDITICGNFAGAADVFSATCSGNCLDLVPEPSNYNNAYFEIAYVRVFTNGTQQGTTPGATTTSSGSNAGASNASAADPPVRISASAVLTTAAAFLIPVLGLLLQ